MREVKLNRDELLKILNNNRKKHREIFLDASAGWKAKVTEELERALENAKAGIRYRTSISLPQPVDQTREYDSVIRMLELSAENVITLTKQEFDAYVLDRWSWRQNFLHSNVGYTSSTKAMVEQEIGSNDLDD